MIGHVVRRVFSWMVLSRILVLVLAGAALPFSLALSTDAPSFFAIGDVHGNFDDFSQILKRTGLVDEKLHWIGGHGTLVQLGDILDRGPKERQALELMMALEVESAAAGGKVIGLLGNHEMMNLMGDLRYVTPQIYASFVSGDSEARRKAAYEAFVKWHKESGELLQATHDPLFDVTEAQWMAQHPLGFIEQREAFGLDGTYRNWISKRDAVAKIGGLLFVHGGISPEVSTMKVEQINTQIQDEEKLFEEMKQYLISEKLILPFFTFQEITAVVKAAFVAGNKANTPQSQARMAKLAPYLKLGTWLSIRDDGPLWFRGYDEWPDTEGTVKVEKIMSTYDASGIIVGHTIQKGSRIRSRFGGRVFLIDTGMVASSTHTGAASALQISDDQKFTAVYLDGQEVLFDRGAEHPAQRNQ
jgi:Calcineurin-like phosphoesterase